MAKLIIHVGYPKTATTTFQRYVYPLHPEINYLGKLIPGFGYVDDALNREIDSLMREDETRYQGIAKLQEILAGYLEKTSKKIVVLSSESFVDGWATDRGVVARRLRKACGECKIVFTLRDQLSTIKSYYSAHGRFGHNLFLSKTELERAVFPMNINDWLKFCFRMFDKNFPGTLMYYDTIRYYQELFGSKNVAVFLFEEFCQDRKSYIDKFADFLGVNSDMICNLIADNHENPNISTPEYLVYRLCLALGIKPEVNRLEGKASRLVKSMSRKFGMTGVNMDETWESRLVQLYGPGNKALMKLTGLSLDKYNYCLD